MRDHPEPAYAAGPTTPVLVVVDADTEARNATESALIRRFEPDYRVVTADSPTGGLEELQRLAGQRHDVALIAADLRLPGMDGIAFLERAHELHPHASRALLLAMDQHHTRIPLTELPVLQRPRLAGSTSGSSRDGSRLRSGYIPRCKQR